MGARRGLGLWLWLLLALAPAAALAQGAPVVATAAGQVQGVRQGAVSAFRGVPYAAPPVGDLRWREPRPAAAWSGVRRAEVSGPACIQTPAPGIPGPFSEDCLNLDVWTPRPEAGAKLPVMVWIYGGAFVQGSTRAPTYDGAPLAGRGAVVVTLNYRLGQLGFFAHPGLEREAPGGPMNFGLLDQVAALRWVRDNIAQFGGDPGNVTIFGESAGAKSVLALYASPMARGLFQRGIAQSNYMIPDATRAKALELGAKVTAAAGAGGAELTGAELRAIPAARLAQVKGLSNAPVPIAGDAVLPRSIQQTFAARQEAPAPLIIGGNSDDISVAAAFGVDTAAVLQRLGAARILVRALYPGVRDEAELGRQAAREVVFTLPARWVADRHSRLAPTWRYYFDYTAVKARPAEPNGAPHGGEIPYTLDTVAMTPALASIATPEDHRFAAMVSGYWFEFARSGKPASPGGPEWTSHTALRDRTMIFADRTELRRNFMKPRLDAMKGAIGILGLLLRPREAEALSAP